MDTGDNYTPSINLIDEERGWKDLTLTRKSGAVVSVRVKAPSWEDVAAIHISTPATKALEIETQLVKLALPEQIHNATPELEHAPFAWLNWLDVASRNLVMQTIREFTYGVDSEKKRAEGLKPILKLLQDRKLTPPSSASGLDSATPSPGADPSSDGSSNASVASKLTTA